MSRTWFSFSALFLLVFAGYGCGHSSPIVAPDQSISAEIEESSEIVLTKRTGVVIVNRPLIGGIFFQNELLPVRSEVASFLRSQEGGGYDVLSIDHLWESQLRAQTGRRWSDGRSCGRPYAPWRMQREVYPNALGASLTVLCEDNGCLLRLFLRKEGRPELIRYWQIDLPVRSASEVNVETVLRGIAHLQPAEPSPSLVGGGLLGGLGARLSPGVHAYLHESVGWENSLTDQWFEGVIGGLDHCLETTRRDVWKNLTLLEFDASGHLTRCEPERSNALVQRGHTCLCQAAKGRSFGRGRAGRRLGVDLIHLAPVLPPGPTLSFNRLYADDPSVTWADTGIDQHALRSCWQSDFPLELHSIPIEWNVLSSGEHSGVRGQWPDGYSVSHRTCAENVLNAAHFSCAQNGQPTTIRTSLTVQPSR